MATHCNPEFAKAWHAYALLNFEAVNLYQNKPEGSVEKAFDDHVFAATRGFIRSIALGIRSQKKSRFILQDSLRLLTLLFKYGHLDEIQKEFKNSFQQIDIIAWIEVVPQIIARISIPDQSVQNLLNHLLIHISK